MHLHLQSTRTYIHKHSLTHKILHTVICAKRRTRSESIFVIIILDDSSTLMLFVWVVKRKVIAKQFPLPSNKMTCVCVHCTVHGAAGIVARTYIELTHQSQERMIMCGVHTTTLVYTISFLVVENGVKGVRARALICCKCIEFFNYLFAYVLPHSICNSAQKHTTSSYLTKYAYLFFAVAGYTITREYIQQKL